jgi:hypothetical protein
MYSSKVERVGRNGSCCFIQNPLQGIQREILGEICVWFNIHVITWFVTLQKATVSSVIYGRANGETQLPFGRIFLEVSIWGFFENVSREFKVVWKLTRITVTLHEDLCTCLKYLWIILRMRNVLAKVVKKIKKKNLQFFSENRAVYEIMLKKTQKYCCVSTATVVTRTRHNVRMVKKQMCLLPRSLISVSVQSVQLVADRKFCCTSSGICSLHTCKYLSG